MLSKNMKRIIAAGLFFIALLFYSFLKKSPESMMDAAALDHAGTLKNLIRKKGLIQRKDFLGNTPLIVAASRGSLNAAQTLIAGGADVNTANHDKGTALMAAAVAGNCRMLELLRDNGAGIDDQDKKGRTALTLAVIQNRRPAVKLLLESGACVNHADRNGETPLHHAAFFGHMDIIELLIEQGANVNKKCRNGCTPLMKAVSYPVVVRLLINSGAQIDAQSQDGVTALSRAAEKGAAKTFQLLINENADLKTNAVGRSILQAAVAGGNKEIVDMLLSMGTDVNIKDNNGNTVLITAALDGNERVDIAADLIFFGADVNQTNKKGWSALMWACERNHVQMAQTLINHGASVDQVNKEGWTPLMRAAKAGHTTIVHLLLKNGAEKALKNKVGLNALACAADARMLEILKQYP